MTAIVDTTDGQVIYDSSWPVLTVKSMDEALLVSDDIAAWEAGDITADEFKEVWSYHPDADFTIAMEV